MMTLSKYNAKKVSKDGYTFDSISEYKRYAQLYIMQKAGAISDLAVHPVFELQGAFIDLLTGEKHRAIHYEADFSYIEAGKYVVEDVKGFETPHFVDKWKIFRYKYPDIDARKVKV